MKTFIVIILTILFRFNAYEQIPFENFKIDTTQSLNKKAIRYQSNPTARRFKTRITKDYKEKGRNFAGHYCFIYWGCGSPCKASAVVDLETGNVYDGPSSSLGYDYRKDSRLLIVNPTDTTGFFVNCPYCILEKWVWNEQKKQFAKLDDK